MVAGVAMAARSSFLRCNSKFFIFPKILNIPFHLFRCNNTVFSHKPLKNPTLDTRTRCIQSTQISTKTENQDMGFVHRPNIVNILEERGLLESTTSENLRSVCSDPNSSPLKVYCGFDPTAESLHLGNLLGIIVLSWFQRCGHRAVTLIGGATARIGDPSGKSTEMPELDVETLERNTKGIVGIISSILNMEEISGLEEEMKRPGYVPNSVQRRLAEEVTRFVHGQEGLSEALKATEALKPGTETKLDWKTIEGIAEDIPSCSLAYDQVLNASLVDLSVSTGLLDTMSAARRLLKQGGIYLNNSRVATEGRTIEAADIVDGKVLLLSAGKKFLSDLISLKTKEISESETYKKRIWLGDFRLIELRGNGKLTLFPQFGVD